MLVRHITLRSKPWVEQAITIETNQRIEQWNSIRITLNYLKTYTRTALTFITHSGAFVVTDIFSRSVTAPVVEQCKVGDGAFTAQRNITIKCTQYSTF